MKKFALTTLAVMAAVGVLAVQPADAKKVQQDPSMALIDMPMNDEIQQVNGVSKSANKETQRLSNKLADATRVMVKKNWKTIYIKAVPTGDKSAVRFYYTDKNGQVYNGQAIRNTGLSKGKYMTGSLRQVEALQELVNHLQQNGQEVPSSIDLIITQGGYRTKTIFNYGEDTSNLPAYQQQYFRFFVNFFYTSHLDKFLTESIFIICIKHGVEGPENNEPNWCKQEGNSSVFV